MVATTAAPAPPTRAAWQGWVSLLVRLVLAGVWIYAASSKIGRPLTSARAVQAYQIFPFDVAAVIGQALPIVELALGALLLLGLFTRFSAAASAVLLLVFMAGIASAWARGLQIDCGCFGDGGADPDAFGKYPWEIARDVGLLLLSLLVVWLRRTPLALDNVLFPPRPENPDG